MEWLNGFGLGFMALIMVPNIIYGLKLPEDYAPRWANRPLETVENLGRFSSMFLMVFNLPFLYGGFVSDEAFAAYLLANGLLVGLYCLLWIVLFRRNTLFRAVALSVLPSLVFLSCGILERYIPLVVASLVFAPCHILISVKNIDPKGS